MPANETPTGARAFRGEHKAKPLKFDPAKLKGLSERLIQSHWENNYGGALKALNAIERRLAVLLSEEDLPPYVYGDLKREELVRTGSVILHEHYFESLGGRRPGARSCYEPDRRVVRQPRVVAGGVHEDGQRPGGRIGLGDPRLQSAHARGPQLLGVGSHAQ